MSFKHYLEEKGVITVERIDESLLGKFISGLLHILAKFIGKLIKSKLYRYGEMENDDGTMATRYTLGNTDKVIGVNYKDKRVDSIDIWDEKNDDWDKPTVTVKVASFDVIRLIPTIIEVIAHPKAGKVDVIEDEKFETEVANVKTKELEESEQLFLTEYRTKGAMGKKTKEGLATGQVVIVDGKPRKAVDVELERLGKMVDEVEYADPETIYEDLEEIVNMVVSTKLQYSLIVAGMAGIGKSKTIEMILEKNKLKKDQDWVEFGGAISPFGIYDTLYRNNGKIIIFDDMDSVFGNERALNLLKKALDSKPVRTVSWISPRTFDASEMEDDEIATEVESGEKLPSTFEFTGKVIFVTNYSKAKLEKISDAVVSRSIVVDITLKPEDVLKRVKTLLPKKDFDMEAVIKGDLDPTPLEDKKKLLEFLLEAIEKGEFKSKKQFNLRTFVQALKFARSGNPHWKRQVLTFI